MFLRVDSRVEDRFPGIRALQVRMEGIRVEEKHPGVERLKEETVQRIRGKYLLDSLKEVKAVRAYRDFMWKLGIDPTKIRPSAEALVRRILLGKPFPTINTQVDVYHVDSVLLLVSIGAFDLDRLEGELLLRFAGEGEEFLGIGMEEPLRLRGGEVVVSDGRKLIAIYPYRDSELTKVTERTRRVLFLLCGVPGVEVETLREAGERLKEYVGTLCGGKPVG
ncbi:MAG: phenylalanine--tRNA ligase beta subunit-related protein [Candidatus Hadarchaeales archaeon]